MDVFIHETAIIKRSLKTGNHVAIDPYVVSSVPMELGNYVHISPNVTIIGGAKTKLTIGNYCFVSAGSTIVCGSEDYTADTMIGALIPEDIRIIKYAPVIFEDHSGVGANCTVLPGVTLARGSVIGAGSVVTKDTEPWGVYAGIPAKLIKYRKHENIDIQEKMLSNT